MKLREKLRKLMKERNVTTAALSRATGLPYTSIDSLLKRDTQASVKISTLSVLQQYFDVAMEYLIDESIDDPNYGKEKKVLSEKEVHLLELYKNNKEAQRLIHSMLENNKEEIAVPRREIKTRYIELYNLPVSAGRGIYIEDNGTEMIKIEDSMQTNSATFALRVMGDSMEPRFTDKDIILIRSQPSIELGQIGIFILNNEAYFKQLGENCLISLNPLYPPIYYTDNDNLDCKGLVLCRMKKARR